MNDNRQRPRGPGIRSGELAPRLQHSREVMDRHRAIERERQQGVADAVRDYWSAWQAITTAEQRRDRRVHTLKHKIDAITDKAADEIAAHRDHQATAVTRLSNHGYGTDSIAELFELSVRGVRALLARARTTTNSQEGQPQEHSEKPGSPIQPPL